MRTLRSMLRNVVSVALGLALALFGGGAYGLDPGQTAAPLHLPGLQRPADLFWDQHGVPHIFAASAADAYRLLGWAHARDRLWQMEMSRRTVQGRKAEILGASSLESDRRMRILGLYRKGEDDARRLSAETRSELDAYAAGVNAYVAAHRDDLPMEFRQAGIVPDAWRPADSLAWFRLMSLKLSYGYRAKTLRAALLDKVPRATFDALFPSTDPAGAITLATRGIDWLRFADRPLFDPAQASNEWVVDGSLTQTGKPLLANDPHLALTTPILWYLARVDTPELTAAGATVPGVPWHILGHNGHIAWGITDTVADSQDLFVEKLAPGDPSRYLTPDGTAAFVRRTESIRVRSQPDVRLEVRESRHGPIVSDFVDPVAGTGDGDKVVALAFLGLQEGNDTPRALRQLNRASDWPSFKAALGDWAMSVLNFVYADRSGNIGFAAAGNVPHRKTASDLPVAGWTGENDWIGVIRSDQLPSKLNPADHKIVNANNRLVPDSFPIYIARHYGLPLRADRIAQLLAAKRGFTVADFVDMQTDAKAGDARLLLPRLLQVETSNERAAKALALLRRWDQTMDRERPEPLVFMSAASALQRGLLAECLGAGAPRAIDQFDYDPYLILRLLERVEAGPEGTNRAAGLVSRAFERAIDDLGKAYGADVDAWRWGRAHPARLGAHPLPISGGPYTVNAEIPRRQSPTDFTSEQGPGLRAVYDLDDLDRSRFVIATGESGVSSSPHFLDMAEPWRDGRTIILGGSLAEVAARASGHEHASP